MKFIGSIKKLRHRLYLLRFRLLPIQENKLLFFSNNAMSYSCNPKYLTEYILENYPQKYRIVWVISTETEIPSDMPKDIKVVRHFSIEYLKEISTCKFIICNTRIPPYFLFKKRKKQFYIQTWHGSLALKVIEADAAKYLPEQYIKDAQYDSSQINMIPASSRVSAEQYRNGFWYDGFVMECGTPRCDIFFNKSVIKKLRMKYGVSDEYKVLIYAPTFRNDKKPDIYGIDFIAIKNTLESVTGNKWKIIFKLHPNLSNINYKSQDKDIVNIDPKADLQELLIISEILITDYSSCMFDMGLMEKKCLLYVPDLENYLKTEREMYFDIESLPFPVCRNNEEIMVLLRNFPDEEYKNELGRFYKKIGNMETGHACEKIEKYICDNCYKGRYDL